MSKEHENFEPSESVFNLALESFKIMWAAVDELNARATTLLGFAATFVGLSLVGDRLSSAQPSWLFTSGIVLVLVSALLAGIAWRPLGLRGLTQPKKALAYEKAHGSAKAMEALIRVGIQDSYEKSLRAADHKGRLLRFAHWSGLAGIFLVAIAFLIN